MLKRFIQIIEKLPKVKAVVVWRENELLSDYDDRFYLWKDFMRLGEKVKNETILKKIPNQRPG